MTKIKLTGKMRTIARCTGCGEAAQFASLNSNGECEACSMICEQCFEPARVVGELNDEMLCRNCESKEEK